MVEVRFLEACYLFSTAKSYDSNDIVELDEEMATSLFKRGVVDILKDEEYLEGEGKVSINDMTVSELRDLAAEQNVEHTGLRKAELVKAIEEVL